ncbi:acyltransferase [Bacteroidia bacterium]|nr:acyltransferase [Bacteroidia bacterium]
MIASLIRRFFSSIIAKIYISVIKPSVDEYYLKSQTKRSKIKDSARLFGRGTIYFPENLSIAEFSRVGDNYFFHCGGGISIGRNTILSRNVTIYSANHNFIDGKLLPYDETYINKKVTIGDNVWIGMGVCILPGVSIGDGAIIGMGAIVTKNVEECDIVVGSGQRVVGKRDMETYNELTENLKFYGKYNNDL